MYPQDSETTNARPASSRWWIPLTLIMAGGFVATGILLSEQHGKLGDARQEVTTLKQEIGALQEARISREAALSQKMEALATQWAAERQQQEERISQGLRQAQNSVKKQTQSVATTLSKSQEEQSQKVAEEMAQLRSASEQHIAKLTEIGAEVGDVRTQVASTRSDLESTVKDLRNVTGDLGVMSGLIATNQKELAALRALGERDYFEFTLSKTKAQQSVGGIQLNYRKADAKRNRFTLTILADDKRVEKKDRTINEPVQFYVVSRARQPFEIVVNEVKKDTLVGYLSVPKVHVASR